MADSEFIADSRLTPGMYQRLVAETLQMGFPAGAHLSALALGMSASSVSIMRRLQEAEHRGQLTPTQGVLHHLGVLLWHLSNSATLFKVDFAAFDGLEVSAKEFGPEGERSEISALSCAGELEWRVARWSSLLSYAVLRSTPLEQKTFLIQGKLLWVAAERLCRAVGTTVAEALLRNLEELAGKYGHVTCDYYLPGVLTPDRVPGFRPLQVEAGEW